jgi:phage recombination protein Bet
MNAPALFTPSQLKLIRNTIAKDASPTEFDLFMEMCRARGLNPLTRHAYCFVFHKDKADKRQMVVVVSIDGQRHLAEKTGNYRADERAARIVDGATKDPTNPKGLVSAEVSVYKFSHGEWFPVTAVAYWEEAAPIKETWEDKKPTGKFVLDPKKEGWHRMPRLMLAKVAEMAALRKAFPDTFSGLYGEAEMDRGEALDLSPSEWVEQAEQEDRLQRVGGPGTYIIDWLDGEALQSVPGGKLHDQAMAFLAKCVENEELTTIRVWQERNRHSLSNFWAIHKADALNLKKQIESILSEEATA